MPTEPSESIRKDALYPDDLPGRGPLVIDEYLYWEAADPDDREELPEDARFGSWLPIQNGTVEDGRQWIAAPRCLREYLEEMEVEAGDCFEVLELEKGPAEHDEYRGEFKLIEEGDPL